MLEFPLRPYQAAAVDAFLARPDKRLILAHSVGAGKTLTAIACGEAIKAQHILVVAPALARFVWVQEFAKWGKRVAHGIRYGRRNKHLSRAHAQMQHDAFHADIQVVSYKLLSEIRATKRDLVIFDEVHALRNPLSQQSRMAKAYMRAFPDTPCLALSATPMPTEIYNIWNVIDTLFPNALGPPTSTGAVSFAFREFYMQKEITEYGTRYFGAKEETLPRLKKSLDKFMHRATEADFAQYLPPLVAKTLYVDDDMRKALNIVQYWTSELVASGREHLAFVCFLRKSALDAYNLLTHFTWMDQYEIVLITGDTPPDERAKMLAKARRQPKCMIIATCESIRESISLSFVKDVLISEWRSSPAQATQLLGRFARADSLNQGVTHVTYVVNPEEQERAVLLQERLEAISRLLTADSKGETLQAVFSPEPMTEERMDSLFEKSFKTFKPAALQSWEDGAE